MNLLEKIGDLMIKRTIAIEAFKADQAELQVQLSALGADMTAVVEAYNAELDVLMIEANALKDAAEAETSDAELDKFMVEAAAVKAKSSV